MLLLKNHIVREVGPFPMSRHIYHMKSSFNVFSDGIKFLI